MTIEPTQPSALSIPIPKANVNSATATTQTLCDYVYKYGTCHNRVTVLRTCYRYSCGHSTGTGMLVPGMQLRACQEYSYRRRMDTALRAVAQLRSTPLCGISH